MSLSANQERGEMEKKRLKWKVEGEEEAVVRGGRIEASELVVELGPMEIRTLLIQFTPNPNSLSASILHLI